MTGKKKPLASPLIDEDRAVLFNLKLTSSRRSLQEQPSAGDRLRRVHDHEPFLRQLHHVPLQQ
jgi:hypothetical protein